MRTPEGDPLMCTDSNSNGVEGSSPELDAEGEGSGGVWHRNLAALKKLADSNLTFLIVGVPVAYAFFLVPQISNIWMYVPYEAVPSAPLQAGPFILFVAATLGFFLFAWRQLLPRRLVDGASELGSLWSVAAITAGAMLIALPQLHDLRDRVWGESQDSWTNRWYFFLAFAVVSFLVLLSQKRIRFVEWFANWYPAQWQASTSRKVLGVVLSPVYALYFVVIRILSFFQKVLRFYVRICWTLADLAGGWLLKLNGFPTGVDDPPPLLKRVPVRIAVGVSAIFLGAAILFFSRQSMSNDWADATTLPLRSFSFWMLLFGAWMIFVNGVEKHQALWPILVSAARWLSVAAVGYVVAEIIWLLAGHTLLGISYRAYTDWAIFLIAFLVLGFASLIDAIHALTHSPVRVIVAMAMIGYLAWLPAGRAPLSTIPVVVAKSDSRDFQSRPHWLDQFASRLKELPKEGPAIFVSASGGGARAAAFTVLVFEALEREPMIDDSGNQTCYSWNDYVVLVSGVSGGSLGAAYAIQHSPLVDAQKVKGDEYAFPPLQNSFESQHTRHVRKQAGQVVEYYEDDLAKLNAAADDFNNILTLEALKRDLKSWSSDILPTSNRMRPSLHFPVYSEHADRMFTDLMAPVFRGVLTPTIDRSSSLGSFWKDKLQFGESTNLDGYARGTSKTWKNAPLAVFNSTEVIRGTRFVVGFPPLPAGFLSSDSAGERTQYDPASLTDFAGSYSMALSDAVRLSASFPVGMPVARLKDGDRTLDLLDGGVNDNTGISTIADILLGIKRISEDATNAALQKKAIAILTELRRRGIIFVEIDSGAKPSQTPRGELLTPGQALSNAALALAESGKSQSKRQFADLLQPLFVGHEQTIRKAKEHRLSRLKDSPGEDHHKAMAQFAVAEEAMRDLKRQPIYCIPFTCNHSNEKDVMTAWSLGPLDKARIVATFQIEKMLWTHKNANLLKAWLSNRKRVGEYFADLDEEIYKIQLAEKATGLVNATVGAAASAAGWSTVPEVPQQAVGYLIENSSAAMKAVAAAQDLSSGEEGGGYVQFPTEFVDKWSTRDFKRVAPVQKSEQNRVARMKGIMTEASGP